MKFSLYRNPVGEGFECACDQFLTEIERPALAEKVARIRKLLAEGKADEAAEVKRGLPCVTWQALSTDGSHRASSMKPNSLFMLDVDGLDDPVQTFRASVEQYVDAPEGSHDLSAPKNLSPAAEAMCNELGILVVHITPSGHGLRFVAKRNKELHPDIATAQAWLANKLGIVAYDAVCKDFSRLAFLCPRKDFIFLDFALWDMDDECPWEKPAPQRRRKTEGGGMQERDFTDQMREFKFRDHLISEIAAKWVESRGEPQEGERNNFYMKMGKMFRNITDDNIGVMLCQLPDLGLPISEREHILENATSRAVSGEIPYVFYKFLVKEGFIVVEKPAEETKVEEPEQIVEEEPEQPVIKRSEKFPTMPPVFREFTSLYPDDFVYPTVVALLPVLGTLATRLRATYIDGRVHTTSFIGVIFAPPASGKSFARDIVNICTKDLVAHDKVSLAKDKLFKREMKMKRNSENVPEEPHAPYRMVQSVISVPKLLERQEDACGLHQFSFTEEIDTLKKSNAGGSYAQKSDLYRQAFDNAEYGQDYMSVDTFTGSVQLFYNILMLGTPNQLYDFFNDAENGLVSRCCFAEILNQEFAPIPFFKTLTEKQQEAITKVLNRFENMTYTRKNAMSDDYLVNKEVNLDAKMDFVREAVKQWLEEKRIECMQESNVSKDIFRRRSAVKAFRLGMICVGMYDNITKQTAKMIERFVLWFAEQDLNHIEKAFGEMLRKQNGSKRHGSTKRLNIFEEVPEEFNVNDVYAAMRRNGLVGEPRETIYIWKKAGLIQKVDNGQYKKITNIQKNKKK